VKLDGREILGVPSSEANRFRGKEIGMIFQDPMTSLNPTMTIGRQIAETLRVHEGLGAEQGRKRAIELLQSVQIPEARKRVDQYPFQFSGGMRQRVMIAMAIACNPKVLIADEPTTALDVTIQAQILNLLKDLQSQRQMSIILITHDLGVVANMADDVAVMYAGQIVESGAAESIFYRSAHPYTVGLRLAMPEGDEARGREKHKLQPIEGSPPDLFSPPAGCAYFERCPHAMRACAGNNPPLWEVERAGQGAARSHRSRCWLHHQYAPQPQRQAIHLGQRMAPGEELAGEGAR
jgi:oligopeptide/dipeptide ABC transporter ATP-binding protein